MPLAGLLNTAWLVKSLPEAWAFRAATRHVASTQADVLRRILEANRDTAFGRQHHFAAIRDPHLFQRLVPLSTYESYTGSLERIAAGAANVLTRERVELLEPTSGTSAGEKLIPYTATLRRQFQRAVAAWMADLLGHRPALRCGRAYWSISPPLSEPRYTSGGIRIGFDDDAAYLGTLERFALERLLIAPPRQRWIGSLAPFRYATLLALLAAPDLALISVWNPTFLTALFASLDEWQEPLCRDLAHAPRAAVVRDILRSRLPLPDKLRHIWPGLALLSCWTDAAAAGCLEPVRALFPWLEIQPKGLLATEGCVSFPLLGRAAPVLAVRSHFFEFEEAGANRSNTPPRLAHELETGACYRVILTTGGGLYRYQLRDIVLVAGWEHRCPLLRFVGKADLVSDLVGEKLAETHVRQILEGVWRAQHWTPAFALLVPVTGTPPRYALYVQGAQGCAAPWPREELQAALEAGLEENPHYRYAVGVGQLAPAIVQVLPADRPSAWSLYEAVCLARGQRVGDIKPAALDVRPGWPEVFAPCNP